MNRTYLQSQLKNWRIIQWLYAKYLMYYAKRFMNHPELWKQWQQQKLAHMLNYARRHCAYYRNLIKENVSVDNCQEIIKTLPLLDKSIIRRQDKSIYSDEITDGWRKWLNTGGSTGEPLKFPALYKGMHIEGVCQMMLYMKMAGGQYHTNDIIVSFGGNRISEEKRSRNIYWEDRSANLPYGKKKFSTLYLDENTVSFYWEELRNTKPAFMRGYPSGIIDLCRYAQYRNFVADFNLKAVYLTSENFTQEDKDFISSILKCPVYGQYGHTESSVFAVQHPDNEIYYCSPIYGYTEVVDSKGTQVKPGETGEIVVTGFIEYGMPFIRYKTGDLAIYGGETENGETIITKLLGREADFIYNKEKKQIFLVGLIFGGHIQAFNYVQTWQIHQDEIGKIDIYIVKFSGYNSQTENEIITLFRNNSIDATVHYVNSIEKTIRGKQKFLIQNIHLS